MWQSILFCKTLKEVPKEADSVSHKLLLRAGYVDQLMAGVYSYLPLGFMVLKKLENIIRQNMESDPVGGQEILMPVLSPKESWQKTGRWDTFDVLFKVKGAGERDYALGPTHEEVVAPLAKKFVFSYKDLPFSLFQIQTKFRDEIRVKSGLLRTREFLMKDLYSFHQDEEDLERYYNKVIQAYFKIFKECGICSQGKDKITYLTLAAGGSFSKYSHEFQTVTGSGEDVIYICKKCNTAINREIKGEMEVCSNSPCRSKDFEERKAVEVGNIFKLGDKYSVPFDLKYRDKEGKEKPVIMGCYGIGLSRLMAAIVEVNNDEKGIIWPEAVAPFRVHLIPVEKSKKVVNRAEKIYENLCGCFNSSEIGQENNIEVLYDDRLDKTVGEKFAEADLLGMPIRIVVSERTLKKASVEVKRRDEKEAKLVKISNIEKFLKK